LRTFVLLASETQALLRSASEVVKDSEVPSEA